MINFDSKKEVYKFLIIAFFTGICIILTYYFHAVLNTGKVFTHFFYIPIILSCLWWKKKGLIVATFLAVLLILSNNFLRTTPITFNDYLRALTFIVIGIIIATMSERISKMMEKIKSEKVFSESIITTIPDSLLILNKDLKIKEANTSFFKIFRIEPEKVIGTHIVNILGDENRELIPELQKLFRTDNILENFELHYLSEKVGERIFNIKARVIIAQEEALLVMEDITERKKADEKLRIFYKFINSSIDGIAMGSYDGRISYVNKAFIKMFGYSEEELIGKEITFIYPESEIPKLKKALNETMEGGWRGVLIGKRKDGKLFPMEIYSSKIVEEEEGMMYVTIATHRNMTKHHENVKRIQLQRKWIESFMQYSILGIVTVDNNNKIISCNPSFEEIFHYKESEIIGRDLDKLVAGKEFFEEAKTITNKATKRGMPSKITTKRKRKDGTWFDVEVFSVPVRVGNKFVGQYGMYHDITGRKKAEEELIRLSNAVRMSTDSIVVSDLDAKIIDVNKATLKMYGADDKKELIGKNSFDLIATEDLERALEDSKKVFEKGYVKDRNYNIITKDGCRIPVEMSTAIMKDKDGKPIGFVGISRDITERKKAEEALRESRDYLEKLTNSMWDAVFSVKMPERVIEWANDSFKLIGYEPEECIGRTTEFLYPDKNEFLDFGSKLKNTLAAGEDILHAEQVLRRKNGKVFPAEITTTFFKKEGKVVNVTSIVRDITERKTAEESLRESEEKYRTLTGNVNVGIYRNTVGPRGKFIEANPAIIKMFGYKTRDEILSMDIADLYQDPGDREKFNKKTLRNGFMKNEELKLKRKDGTLFYGSISAVAVKGKNGEVKYYDGIIEDITERKRVEEELSGSREQLRKLAEHLQSVREEERTWIAREIHDELGQIMTALKMDLSWLNNKIPMKKILKEKIKTMSKLIDTTIQKVQRISTELRPGILDDLGLPSAIEWYAEEFQQRTGIQCKITINPEDIILVRDLSTTIFRIFQETLINVARHANATWVIASLRVKDNKLEMKVRDNGIGIKKEQVSAPNSFGLIGMRERVYPWGGDFKIKGIRNKGTTVTVTIPLQKYIPGGTL